MSLNNRLGLKTNRQTHQNTLYYIDTTRSDDYDYKQRF